MKHFLLIVMVSFLVSCAKTETESEPKPEQEAFEISGTPTNRVVLSSEIEWEQLNPARGDKSPMAGTVWGDRKGTVATGFLAKFVDGFSSPPHIHNVTYRAMVIQGLIHNDDPDAAKMWMPPGSFWTQPAGESHITAAKGEVTIAYVEIDEGPYLVKPIEEAFDNGESPINVDKDNLIWLDASKTTLIEEREASGPAEVAFLWEHKSFTGNLIRLSPGHECELLTSGDIFHAIIVSGELNYELPQTKETKSLDPGSYFGSTGKAIHRLTSKPETSSIVYFRTNGAFKIR